MVQNKESVQYGEIVSMVTVVCCSCGIPFGMPERFRKKLMETQEGFYCPAGHGQSYSKSTAEILKEQLQGEKEARQKEKDLLQNAASKAQELAKSWHVEWESQVKQKEKIAAKLMRTEKRIANGVCPCCNRTFKDLAEHMKTQHPGQNS